MRGAPNLAAQLRADSRVERNQDVARRLIDSAARPWSIASRCRGTVRSDGPVAAEEMRRALAELLDVRTG